MHRFIVGKATNPSTQRAGFIKKLGFKLEKDGGAAIFKKYLAS